jgi:hypothetical protein
MSIFTKDWTRWIFASLSNYFNGISKTDNPHIPFYVEGQEKPQNSFVNDQGVNIGASAELRLNGPFFNNPSNKKFWKIEVDVNILITVTIDNEDLHKIYNIIDRLLEGFNDSIPLYNYDNPLEFDDDHNPTKYEFLGCLIMRTGGEDDIIITNFGRIDPTLRIQQSTINSIYQIQVTE